MDDKCGTESVRIVNDPAEWFEHSLRLLFENVIAQVPNALDPTGTKGIHHTRVAIRRLRSALRAIELVVGDHPAKAASKKLKALADTLGDVRDEDVVIDELKRLSEECDEGPIRTGICSLIQRSSDRRKSAFAELQDELTPDFQQDLCHRFETSLGSLLGKIRHSKRSDIQAFGGEIVGALLKDLNRFGVKLYDPFDRKALHSARIATKRLRYAIDLLADCWGEQAERFSKECARMQGFLGDAHDRDVWMDELYKVIKTSKASKTDDDADIEAAKWLVSAFVKERTKNYRKGLRLWGDWRANRFFENLEDLTATG